MTKHKQLTYLIAVGLCVLLGLFCFSLTGYRFSGWMLLGLAALLGVFFLLDRFPSPTACTLRRVLILCLVLGILAASVTGFFIGSAAAGGEGDCDYIIILGAAVHGSVPSLALRERLDAALAYLQAHPDTVCVASGGQGDGEDISEAECMYRYLTERGIAPERILREDSSTSTRENIAFSLDVIQQATGSRPQTAGVVSSEYHLFRASLIAQKENLTAIGIPAKTTWVSLRVNYFLREIAATWYLLIGG